MVAAAAAVGHRGPRRPSGAKRSARRKRKIAGSAPDYVVQVSMTAEVNRSAAERVRRRAGYEAGPLTSLTRVLVTCLRLAWGIDDLRDLSQLTFG